MQMHTNQCCTKVERQSLTGKPEIVSLIIVFLTALLLSLSFTVNAAKVASVISSGSQTTVNDQGSDGTTKIAIAFSETTGVWLDMDPSSTELNEKFQISLQNNTGEDISELWFEVVKPEGEDLGTRPTLNEWRSSVSASQFGGLNISESSFVVDQSDRQRFHMSFDPPLSKVPGNSMTIISNTDWIDFNKAGGKWFLNIDWNVEDSNGPSINTTSQPTPRIFANEGEEPLTVQTGENLMIAITLKSGASAGNEADWWIAAQSSEFGWFEYTIDKGWQPILSDLSNIQPVYQGALIDLNSPFELLSSTDIPKSSYQFYFAVDQKMNGVLDFDELVFESVKVNVE